MGLVVKNVNKSFGDKHVVDNISFELKKPGVFGLLGTNGAGKTTTIRMMLGRIVVRLLGMVKRLLEVMLILGIYLRREGYILRVLFMIS